LEIRVIQQVVHIGEMLNWHTVFITDPIWNRSLEKSGCKCGRRGFSKRFYG